LLWERVEPLTGTGTVIWHQTFCDRLLADCDQARLHRSRFSSSYRHLVNGLRVRGLARCGEDRGDWCPTDTDRAGVLVQLAAAAGSPVLRVWPRSAV